MRPSSKKEASKSIDNDVPVMYGDLPAFIEKLFFRVFFAENLQQSSMQATNTEARSIGKYEKVLLEYLREDQFKTGLWGKSIEYLFIKCFKEKEVPAEYRDMGSFSATDIVLRDLISTGISDIWNKESILKTIKDKSDIFGGVGLRRRIDINKFTTGQFKIDSNIRHTCAVININLLLNQFEDALLSLKWLYQFENHWVDPGDGKMPINIACLVDCIDHARDNSAFAKFCYSRPKEFRHIKDGFLLWDEKRDSLLINLNKSLGRDAQLWILRDADGKILNSTKIYITLFILLRLKDYPSLYPREFCQIVYCLYQHRREMGLPISPDSQETWDVGATGTFLSLVLRPAALAILKSGLPKEKYAEVSNWCNDSYENLLTVLLSDGKHITSFAEIISPLLSLIKLNRSS